MKPTVSGTYPLDPQPELHSTPARALNVHESTDGNPTGYVGPTRSASFPTEVNNVVTRPPYRYAVGLMIETDQVSEQVWA